MVEATTAKIREALGCDAAGDDRAANMRYIVACLGDSGDRAIRMVAKNLREKHDSNLLKAAEPDAEPASESDECKVEPRHRAATLFIADEMGTMHEVAVVAGDLDIVDECRAALIDVVPVSSRGRSVRNSMWRGILYLAILSSKCPRMSSSVSVAPS